MWKIATKHVVAHYISNLIDPSTKLNQDMMDWTITILIVISRWLSEIQNHILENCIPRSRRLSGIQFSGCGSVFHEARVK